MEQYWVSKGLLLSNFHKHYWLGYNSDSQAWPLFKPVDASILPLDDPNSYDHWGILRFSNASVSAMPEPNNVNGGEYCSVANNSQTYVGAWGWSDTSCGGQYVVMCMVQSKWLGPRTAQLVGHGPRGIAVAASAVPAWSAALCALVSCAGQLHPTAQRVRPRPHLTLLLQ